MRGDPARDMLGGLSVLPRDALYCRGLELKGGEPGVIAQRVLSHLLLGARCIEGAVRQQCCQPDGEEDEAHRDRRR